MANKDILTSTANLHALRLKHRGDSQRDERQGKQLCQMLPVLLIHAELVLVAVTAPRLHPTRATDPDMTASYVGMKSHSGTGARADLHGLQHGRDCGLTAGVTCSSSRCRQLVSQCKQQFS